ncbi:MAG: c-type cytochrome [Nitriliruptorales bacterium]|nr:c-type cytochrome [Nitriliruptorales bacterium]
MVETARAETERPAMPRKVGPLTGWFVVAAIALVAWSRLAQADAADQALTAEQRQTAETIYANQCATCHGSDGNGLVMEGTDRRAPALNGNPEVTVPYVDLTVRVGRMPPPESKPFDNRARHVLYDDEQRRALVLYLAERFDLAGAIPEPPEGDAAEGRQIYAANCAQCHGSTGAGGVAGAGAWTPPVVTQGPVAVAEAIREGPFEMPRFGPEQISDKEIGDVAAFLQEVAAEQGTLLGLVELNPVYASGFAFLMALVVLVSALWVAGRPTLFPDSDPPRDSDAGEHQGENR